MNGDQRWTITKNQPTKQTNTKHQKNHSNLCGQAQEVRMTEPFQNLNYIPYDFQKIIYIMWQEFFHNPTKPQDICHMYVGFWFEVKIEF